MVCSNSVLYPITGEILCDQHFSDLHCIYRCMVGVGVDNGGIFIYCWWYTLSQKWPILSSLNWHMSTNTRNFW